MDTELTAPISQALTSPNHMQFDSVHDITFDKLGFLWIASNQGVLRFDGYYFENFNKINTPYFIENQVTNLISMEGYLYALSNLNQCLRFNIYNLESEPCDPKSLQYLRTDQEYSVQALHSPNQNKTNLDAHHKSWSVPHLNKVYKINSSGVLCMQVLDTFRTADNPWQKTNIHIPVPVNKIITNRYQNAHFIATQKGLIWLSECISPSEYYFNSSNNEVPLQFSKVTISDADSVWIRNIDIKQFGEIGADLRYNPKKERMQLRFSPLDFTLYGSYFYSITTNEKTIEQGFVPEITLNATFNKKGVLEIYAQHSLEQNNHALLENFIRIKIPHNYLLSTILWLIILTSIAIMIFFYKKTTLNSIKSEERVKELISMDLHDELGTILTRTFLRVQYLSGEPNPALTSLKQELNTSIQALKNFILILSKKHVTVEHIMNYSIDKISNMSQKCDISASYKLRGDQEETINPDTLMNCNFFVNEICYAVPKKNSINNFSFLIEIDKKNVHLHFIIDYEPLMNNTNKYTNILCNKLEERIRQRLSNYDGYLSHRIENNSESIKISISK